MIPSHFTPAFINEKLNTNMTKFLGIEYTEVGEDFLCAKMPVDERTQQPFNMLHGGASVVLAESLGSLGANLCVNQEKEYCVGLEVNANHIRGVKSGWVYGKATAVHIGQSTHVWEIRIHDEQEKLVCISRLTMAVVKKK